jgi:nucleoside-diphosphate-sugar epimerase
MRVLVTGHNGYVGTVLVPMLLKAGHEVVGLDSNLYQAATFGEEDPAAAIPSIQRDVRDVTYEDLEGFQAILHLAGSVQRPAGRPQPGVDLRHQPPRLRSHGPDRQGIGHGAVHLLVFVQQLWRGGR